eukprot:CAMPEP_0115114618 /NCGR_PEP_ID=MMETSP0227-20121206/42171_1 /TAXON_ID=89957 /ORGANISM="Polarella glacialis, Strain CCMP 1383" /LENGTH=108 /DNA_ID=CAMNT_0002515067 /DNA_START=299 /DNA_END=625 /DNA_ORIENTATION=-
MNTRLLADVPALMAAAQALGIESSPPGKNRAIGNSTAEAMMVNTMSWLVFLVVLSSPKSPTLPYFTESTLRVTNMMLDNMAVRNPNIVKESSPDEARATPKKTGANER